MTSDSLSYHRQSILYAYKTKAYSAFESFEDIYLTLEKRWKFNLVSRVILKRNMTVALMGNIDRCDNLLVSCVTQD